MAPDEFDDGRPEGNALDVGEGDGVSERDADVAGERGDGEADAAGTGANDVEERDTEGGEHETGESEHEIDGRETEGVRETAIEEVDQRIVDLLSWILDTETRAKIYIYLLANPGSTSEEVAKGTGLYPSTVREALAELHEEDRVNREKRESEGAGNNPYAYTAIKPSELVGGVVDQVQGELNTIFRLDRILDRGEEPELEEDVEPVTITVDDGGVTVLDEDEEETATISTPGADEPTAEGTDGRETETDEEADGIDEDAFETPSG